MLGRAPKRPVTPVFDEGDWPPPPPPVNIPPRQGRRQKRNIWGTPEIEYCQVCPGKDVEINRLAADLEAAKQIAAQALSDKAAAQEMARLAKVAEGEAEKRLFQFMSDNGFIGKAHMVDE